jgi:hypothetical protein
MRQKKPLSGGLYRENVNDINWVMRSYNSWAGGLPFCGAARSWVGGLSSFASERLNSPDSRFIPLFGRFYSAVPTSSGICPLAQEKQ